MVDDDDNPFTVSNNRKKRRGLAHMLGRDK